MRVLMLLAVFASLALSARAQATYDPLDFAALHVGNRWEYRYSDGRTEASAVPRYYTVAEIPTTQVIGGEAYFVLTEQRISLDGVPTGLLRHCAYSPSLGAATAEQAGLPNYQCPLLPSPPPANVWAPTTILTNEPYTVGSMSYVAEALLSYGNQSSGSGGAWTGWVSRRVSGLGELSHTLWGRHHWASCPNNPADCDFWTANRLMFARIDGQTYGASVVADEALPTASSFAVQVVPTPSVGPWHVRVRGTSRPVTVTVFDLLGRQVHVAPAEVRVPDLPAGAYVLRATDADGRTATTRFVRP